MQFFRSDYLVSRFWQRTGVQTRFALLLLIIGIPFLAFIAISAMQQEALEKQQVRDRSLALAQLVAARLDDHLKSMDERIAAISHFISPSAQNVRANDLALQKLQADLPSYINNIAVWGADGTNIGSLDPVLRDHRFNVSDRMYFTAAIARRGLAIEAPIVSRTNGEYIAQFARPIYDQDRHLLAVISASVRLRELQQLLDLKGKQEAGTVVSIIDQRGNILARSLEPEKWIGKNIIEQHGVRDSLVQQEGSSEQRGLDGTFRVAGYTTARVMPWLVYVGIPLDAALAPIRVRFYYTLGYGMVILALAMALAAWFGRRFSQPLLELAADAKLLGEGYLTHRSTVRGGIESANLATTLNTMAASLEQKNAEISRSEEWLQSITDTIPALISYIDTNEVYRFANGHYEELLGLGTDKIIGKRVIEILDPASYEIARPNILKVLSGFPVKFAYAMTANGITRDVVATYLPDYGPDGTVQGYFVYNEDITEQKTFVQALALSEARIRAITDNLPALIAHLDSQQRYRFVNAFIGKTFGIDPEEMMGRTMREIRGEAVYATLQKHVDAVLAGQRVNFEGEGDVAGRHYYYRSEFIPDLDVKGAVQGFYAMTFDTTEQKLAEIKLAEGEARLRTITDNLPAFICYINREEVYTFNNLPYEAMLHKPVAEITGRPVADALPTRTYERIKPFIDRAMSGERANFEVEIQSAEGRVLWIRGVYIPDRNTAGEVIGIYGMTSDVTKIKTIEHQLVHLAQFDELTQLPNRRHFDEYFRQAILRVNRAGAGMALMFIDIDQFKQINESFGYPAGDNVLKNMASRIESSIRETDFVARMGADEFVVILEGISSLHATEAVAKKISDMMRVPLKVKDQDMAITVSIGVTFQIGTTLTAETFLQKSDEALGFAKASGRNAIRVSER